MLGGDSDLLWNKYRISWGKKVSPEVNVQCLFDTFKMASDNYVEFLLFLRPRSEVNLTGLRGPLIE